MEFVQIPNVIEALRKVRIETLSPSGFSWVCNGCAYQVLLQKAISSMGNRAYSLPSHKNTMLGTIIHSLYEKTSKGQISDFQQMTEFWNNQILATETKLAELYPTLRNPSINDFDKRNKAIRYAISLLNKHTSEINNEVNSSKMVYAEEKLSCGDIGLLGIADKVIVDNGNIQVVDYKSGHVNDANGEIKKEYVVQLHLYAKMCEHVGLGNVKSLNLIDIDGCKYDIEYNPDLGDLLLSEVAEKILVLNDSISKMDFEHLVSSNPENCSNCSCRHVCSYIKQSDEAIYRTISGCVEKVSSSNMFVINDGYVCNYISGLDVYSIENPISYVGKKLVFLNLVKSTQDSDQNTYKVTENSLIYELL